MVSRGEYYQSWDSYAKEKEKAENEEEEQQRQAAQAASNLAWNSRLPSNPGYEFRKGHKTRFPDCDVLNEDEGQVRAAFRVASECRSRGVDHFKEGTVWSTQQAVDAWGQGLLALERLKNLLKYRPMREVDAGVPEKCDDDPPEDEVLNLNVTLRLNLAQALIKLKEFEGAMAHCERALELDPLNPKGWWRKAKAVWETRNPGLAREALHKLLELEPGNPAALSLLQEIEQEETKKRSKRTGVGQRRPQFGGSKPASAEWAAAATAAAFAADLDDNDDDGNGEGNNDDDGSREGGGKAAECRHGDDEDGEDDEDEDDSDDSELPQQQGLLRTLFPGCCCRRKKVE